MRNKNLIQHLVWAINEATENESFAEEEQTIIKFLGFAIKNFADGDYNQAISNIELMNSDFKKLCGRQINQDKFNEMWKD